MFDLNLFDKKKLFNQKICISTRGVTHSQNQFPLDISNRITTQKELWHTYKLARIR